MKYRTDSIFGQRIFHAPSLIITVFAVISLISINKTVFAATENADVTGNTRLTPKATMGALEVATITSPITQPADVPLAPSGISLTIESK